MGGRSVRVLHLSDLHMRGVDGPQAEPARLEAASRWRVLGAKWTANLAEIGRDGTPVDPVVFTGDLGDWGHPTDYPRALAFLKQTCAAPDVPLDRLFVVPGNHDIDRTVQRVAWESLRRDVVREPQAHSRWLAGGDRGALRGDDRRDEGDEDHQSPNACRVIDLTLDEHARPRAAAIRFRGWSERGMFWGNDAPLYERARSGVFGCIAARVAGASPRRAT